MMASVLYDELRTRQSPEIIFFKALSRVYRIGGSRANVKSCGN